MQHVESYISAKVDVLRISSCRNGVALLRRLVDAIDRPKRIDVFLEIGQGTIRAWLERGGIAAGGRVECVDRGEDRI